MEPGPDGNRRESSRDDDASATATNGDVRRGASCDKHEIPAPVSRGGGEDSTSLTAISRKRSLIFTSFFAVAAAAARAEQTEFRIILFHNYYFVSFYSRAPLLDLYKDNIHIIHVRRVRAVDDGSCSFCVFVLFNVLQESLNLRTRHRL